MQVRLAEAQDAQAIKAVINVAFRKAESFFIDGDRATLELMRSLLSKGKFLVAVDSGGIVGCVYVELRADRAYLGLLCVDPERQHHGLGSVLMNAAEEYCAKCGSRFVDLKIVNVRQELPAFYRKRGYVVTGTSAFTAGLNPKLACHFVEMTKELSAG
jgi:GNAT superfamily N-acetyltransferase